MARPKTYESLYTDEQWGWVAERYRDGYTVESLADFLRMHRNSVIYHLRKMGCYPRQNLPPLEQCGFPGGGQHGCAV